MRCLTFAFLTVGAIALPCQGKPTREEIVAYHKKCRDEFIEIDLIAKFGADYRGLDLRGIDLRGEGRNGQWIHTNLRGADLSEAILEGVVLTGVILDGANLKGVKAKGVALGQAHLGNANLDDADLREANLDFIRLHNGSARRADLTGAEISAAEFLHANLSGAILRKVRCQWYPPHFRGADLTDVDFEGAQLLPGADFSSANLSRAILRGNKLVQADFRNANLEKAVFDDTDVDAALFQDARGISAAELAGFERRAARWKYDLSVFAENALLAMHVLAFFLVPPLAIGIGWHLRRHAPERFQKGLGTVAIWLNVSALVALFVLMLFLFCGSPVAQFNVGDDARMSAWSFWVRFFPILMFALGVGFCASGILVIVSLARVAFDVRGWWRSLLGAALTLLHFGLVIQFIGRFFPTA